MSREQRQDHVARRTFLTRLTTAAAAFGTVLGVAGRVEARPAQAAAARAGGWQPARHAEDDWFDQTSAKHRLFLDTTTAAGLKTAMAFSTNFFEANATGYKLTDADLAQVICMRHYSTPFAFTDPIWAKYGAIFAELVDISDPATKQPYTVNPYEVPGGGGDSTTLSALAKRGVRYAVCTMATRYGAGVIAKKTGGKEDGIFTELTQHLVPNAHLVSAGIVAVNRAQERGYTATTVV